MIGFEDLVMFWDLTVAFSQCRLDFFPRFVVAVLFFFVRFVA